MNLDRLSSFSQVVLRFYECAQSMPLQQFQDAALSDIKGILAFDSSMWGTATMSEQGIDIHTLHLHRTTMQMIEEYAEVKHLDHFAHQVTDKERNTIRFSARDARAPALQEFLYRHRHFHGLITQSINPKTQFVHWLSLFREEPDHECSVEDVELLEALFPHLMQALAINRKLYMEQFVGDTVRARWTVAIADHHGFFYHADPEFLQIISQDYATHSRDRLPHEVTTAFSRSVFEVVGNQSILVGAKERDLLFLKARYKVPADALNPRELSIARMLASGLTHKEIAEKLNRSPETIRTHGKSIYKKLGTTKVTQLSNLLAQRE